MPDSPAATPNPLLPLRQQIDEIDRQLLALLAARFRVTDEVGQYKAAHALPAIDPVREQDQMHRVAEAATLQGLDPQFAQRVFRVVIDKVVENHRALAAAAQTARQ
ncbi:P-protein [Andreprevotia sp. IGB-42]|uniref:chorismate mutase n=1 Tax=Andreprevotia sp. IGB-42 TaxID=2497473 RepID=UPI0013591FC9|nr:chorismate mutase [Andreprevotia sp. IGB-42]KAF0814646.1 P-protein [Andreprevotia sp. IGB-42]